MFYSVVACVSNWAMAICDIMTILVIMASHILALKVESEAVEDEVY